MALSIDKLELSNIRTHTHFVFEPADEGLTSISGPNGSGKSTIVDSIAWALYGTKPQGVSKVVAIAREGTQLGKEKCFARLDLTVDGRVMRIERRMVNKGGSVECEVFEMLPQADGTKEWTTVAGPAVSHAEPYIRKLLHMDEKGFLAAILIQQKQVDQLISATPRERAAVIEKLTGISSVTAAVTESRQEYNTIRKMASFSTVNEDELDKLKEEKESVREELHDKTAHYNQLTKDEKTLKAAGVELKNRVETEAEKFEQALEDTNRMGSLKATIEAKEKEFTRLTRDKEAKKKKLSSSASSGTLSEIEEKLSAHQSDLQKRNELIYKAKTEVLDIESSLVNYGELLERSTVKDLAGARKGLAAQEKKITLAQESKVTAQKAITTAASKAESVENAIQVISGGDGECPTCLQKVADAKAAIGALEKSLAEFAEEGAQAKADLEKFTKAEESAKDARLKFQQLIEAIEGTEEGQARLKEAQEELGRLMADVKTFETEVKALEKIYNQAKAQEELKQEYEQALAYAQEVSSEIETLKGELERLKTTDRGALTQSALNKLRKELESSRGAYMKIASELTETRGEIKLLTERKKHLTEKVESQEEAVKKHKELLKSVEVGASRTQLLEEFRANRIESSVPLIEAYASDLLSRFTEGKFTRLKIDGKFNASVVLATGAERAIGLLSGGELSAASMSLRLAISMLLNGGSSQSLIILDEVLVSQDAARAELILATIKDVCKGQVVLIAHNDSITDVSDKIVALA